MCPTSLILLSVVILMRLSAESLTFKWGEVPTLWQHHHHGHSLLTEFLLIISWSGWYFVPFSASNTLYFLASRLLTTHLGHIDQPRCCHTVICEQGLKNICHSCLWERPTQLFPSKRGSIGKCSYGGCQETQTMCVDMSIWEMGMYLNSFTPTVVCSIHL